MENLIRYGGGGTLNIQAKSAIALNLAVNVDIDLGSVKTIVACSAGAGQRSNNSVSTTLLLTYGTSDYTENTIGQVSVPSGSVNAVTSTTKIQARYLRALNTGATWNSVHLSVVYE